RGSDCPWTAPGRHPDSETKCDLLRIRRGKLRARPGRDSRARAGRRKAAFGHWDGLVFTDLTKAPDRTARELSHGRGSSPRAWRTSPSREAIYGSTFALSLTGTGSDSNG